MPRDLTVRVRADVGPYKAAMSAAASSTNQFAQSGLKLQKIGMGISNLGDTLTKRVTLPLGLAGAAAIKMATDFDASFVQMQTLAGVTGKEVDGLKESVLDLAGETGRAPQELADALYFLQSAGLDSKQAMEALEASAKASAVGLGSTRDVADAVSSAMLAYADSGLSAAEATDVLIATAREGKAEPAELANQMGRLLPVASQLGVTFGDVGANIALLSRAGNNAEQATTGLVNVMTKLIKPSQQALATLSKYGLTLDDIRASIAEKGLRATLQDLMDLLGKDAFAKFFEDQQAVTAAFALLNVNAKEAEQVFKAVTESAGATDNAFSKWADSMGAQNAQAFAKFQVALIRVGEVLAPIASDVLSFIAQIAEAFNKLPGPVQTAIIAFAGFAAVLGPIMSVGGRLITVVGTIIRLLDGMALPAGRAGGQLIGHLGPGFTQVSSGATGAASATSRFSSALRGLGTVTVAVAGLIALREILGTIKDDIEKTSVSKLENELLDLGRSGEIVGPQLERILGGEGPLATGRDNIDQFGKGAIQFREDIDALDDALAQLAARDPKAAAAAFERITAALERQGIPAARTRGEFDAYADALASTDTASRTAAGGADELTGAMGDIAGAVQTATVAAEEYLNAVRAMFDPQFAMIDALQQSAKAQTELRDSTKALADARAAGDTEKIAEAEARYAEAVNGARGSVVDLHAAAVTLKAQMQESGQTADEVAAQFIDLATQQGFTRAEALTMAAAFGIATGQANTLGATDPNVAVSETGNKHVQVQLGKTRESVSKIPGAKTITVTTLDQASGTIRVIQRNVDRLTGKTITITTRLVQYAVPSYQTFGGGQAAGGPVSASKWYIVGEKGPEAFVPDQSGYIVPNHAMGSVGNWGGGGMGGGYVDNRIINITTGADPQAVVAALRRAGDMGLPVTLRGRSL